MTIDDAAAILDVSEGHVKDLIRDGDLAGARGLVKRGYFKKYPKPHDHAPPSLKAGEWWVDGRDVRARRHQFAKAKR